MGPPRIISGQVVPVDLGALPRFDRTRPNPYPAGDPRWPFSGPQSASVPDIPGGNVPASPVGQLPRPRWIYQHNNIPITTSNTQPTWPVNPYRCFLLIQNLDPAVTLLITFGTAPNINNALQLLSGVGFVWDQADSVPQNTVYVGSVTNVTVQPIGIEGARVPY